MWRKKRDSAVGANSSPLVVQARGQDRPPLEETATAATTGTPKGDGADMWIYPEPTAHGGRDGDGAATATAAPTHIRAAAEAIIFIDANAHTFTATGHFSRATAAPTQAIGSSAPPLRAASATHDVVSIIATLCGPLMLPCRKKPPEYQSASLSDSDSDSETGTGIDNRNGRFMASSGAAYLSLSPTTSEAPVLTPTDNGSINYNGQNIPTKSDNNNYNIRTVMKIVVPVVGVFLVLVCIVALMRRRKHRHDSGNATREVSGGDSMYSNSDAGSSSVIVSTEQQQHQHQHQQGPLPEMTQIGPSSVVHSSTTMSSTSSDQRSTARLRPPPNIASLDVSAIASGAPVQIAAASPRPPLAPLPPRGHSMFSDLPPEDLPPYIDPIVEAMTPAVAAAVAESPENPPQGTAASPTHQHPPPYHTIDTPTLQAPTR
ncbi:hypothetical protein GQ54DRAFT_311298 [Martensiomyces pterosporus]|nr:hypothetical protein GQ54DRAFT_311298 [Martensiomyces pterosporus]